MTDIKIVCEWCRSERFVDSSCLRREPDTGRYSVVLHCIKCNGETWHETISSDNPYRGLSPKETNALNEILRIFLRKDRKVTTNNPQTGSE